MKTKEKKEKSYLSLTDYLLEQFDELNKILKEIPSPPPSALNPSKKNDDKSIKIKNKGIYFFENKKIYKDTKFKDYIELLNFLKELNKKKYSFELLNLKSENGFNLLEYEFSESINTLFNLALIDAKSEEKRTEALHLLKEIIILKDNVFQGHTSEKAFFETTGINTQSIIEYAQLGELKLLKLGVLSSQHDNNVKKFFSPIFSEEYCTKLLTETLENFENKKNNVLEETPKELKKTVAFSLIENFLTDLDNKGKIDAFIFNSKTIEIIIDYVENNKNKNLISEEQANILFDVIAEKTLTFHPQEITDKIKEKIISFYIKQPWEVIFNSEHYPPKKIDFFKEGLFLEAIKEKNKKTPIFSFKCCFENPEMNEHVNYFEIVKKFFEIVLEKDPDYSLQVWNIFKQMNKKAGIYPDQFLSPDNSNQALERTQKKFYLEMEDFEVNYTQAKNLKKEIDNKNEKSNNKTIIRF